jgi:hypothetical protein
MGFDFDDGQFTNYGSIKFDPSNGALTISSDGGVQVNGNASTATSASYALTASYALNAGGEASAETGNLLFENIFGEIYGSAASPVTGNITIDGSSVKLDGAVAIVYHQDSVEPTVTGGTINKKIGNYESGSLNVITFTNIDGSNFLEYIAGGTVTTVATASFAVTASYAVSAGSATSASYAPASNLQAVLSAGGTANTNLEITDSTSAKLQMRADGRVFSLFSLDDSGTNRIEFLDSSEVNIAELAFTPASADLDIRAAGAVKIQNLEYPSTDGTTGQVLATNGSNGIAFTSTVPSASVATSAVSASYAVTSSYTETIENLNTNSGSLSFWQGTQTEYDAISGSASNSTIYFII